MTASNQFLIFLVDGHKLAMRLESVEQVCPAVEITPLPEAPATVMGLVNVHGSIVVVLNLRKKLNLKEREIELSDQLIIANSNDRQFALLVDLVEGVLQITPDQIKDVSSDRDHELEVIQVEDGVIVVHQLAQFLSESEEETLRLAFQMAYTKQ